MKINTYTKRDIANEFSRRQNQSVRKSIEYTDTLFNILRDILIEDNPYTRIEIRNFGVLESKPTKAKPRARTPGIAPKPTAITSIIAIMNSGIALKKIVTILADKKTK